MNHPCNLRPSNGKQCAIDFGRKYVAEHGKIPGSTDIEKHLHLAEYSYQWASVLRQVCWDSAREALKTSDHPQALKDKIARLKKDLAEERSQRIYAERCGNLTEGRDGYGDVRFIKFEPDDECYLPHRHYGHKKAS